MDAGPVGRVPYRVRQPVVNHEWFGRLEGHAVLPEEPCGLDREVPSFSEWRDITMRDDEPAWHDPGPPTTV
ncbi:hypothetical protein LCGC14_2299210, partial [marine sediment metagenome]